MLIYKILIFVIFFSGLEMICLNYIYFVKRNVTN